MSANFIPPIPIGQFKPSSEAIASWLYEVWKYLQENPIPGAADIAQESTRVTQNYVNTNVPPMIAAAIADLAYNDLVDGTSLPIYRASNDEIGPQDLLEAWDDGCRFALVDDDSVYVMIKNGNTINLLQILTETQAQGVLSVNGQTGNVILPIYKIAIGNCETAADVSEKTVTINDNNIPGLESGLIICVRMSYTNTAANPSLKLNNYDAKNIVMLWSDSVGQSLSTSWRAGQTVIFRYDGTNWVQLTPPMSNIYSTVGRAETTPSGVWATTYHNIHRYNDLVIVNIAGRLNDAATPDGTILINNLPTAVGNYYSNVTSTEGTGETGCIKIEDGENVIKAFGASWANSIQTKYINGQLIYYSPR